MGDEVSPVEVVALTGATSAACAAAMALVSLVLDGAAVAVETAGAAFPLALAVTAFAAVYEAVGAARGNIQKK